MPTGSHLAHTGSQGSPRGPMVRPSPPMDPHESPWIKWLCYALNKRFFWEFGTLIRDRKCIPISGVMVHKEASLSLLPLAGSLCARLSADQVFFLLLPERRASVAKRGD